MGADKALLPHLGETLVSVVAARMAAVCSPVLLASGTPGRLGGLGWPEVADAALDRGPIGGIIAGLGASPRRLLAVVAVDMPQASPEVLRLLARICAGGGWDAAVPVTGAGPEPLHAVYSRRALPALQAALADDRLAMRRVVAGMRVALVGEEAWGRLDPTAAFAANVNTRDQLALLA
jgi:molybdopterin-guanine dinucleotide biosynthesis protein A